MGLPLRNWRATTSQARRLGSATTESYGNALKTAKNVKKTYVKTRKEYRKLEKSTQRKIKQLKRVGVERYVFGQKSIYSKTPSQITKEKFGRAKTRIKQYLGGGMYG